MTSTYDLIVVGGGPAGYQAAQLAGRAGMRVLLVERAALGGTCLNAGCIPTKTLLRSAKLFREINNAAELGLEVADATLHLDRVQARKRDIVATLQAGVRALLARGQVEIVSGEAYIPERGTIRVQGETYTTDHLLIATGAAPTHEYPGAITTNEALELKTIPKSLGIIGGGPISFGLASIFATMGSHVTVVEPGTTVLPNMDDELRAALLAAIPEITVHSNTASVNSEVIVENLARRPNLDAVSALNLDIRDGGIRTDEHMRTNLPGVYAAGDVTGHKMWAHVALREAEVAVNHMLSHPDRMRYAAVPVPIYTVPEAAYVGLTETSAREAGYNVRVYRLPMSANGRFLIEHPGASGQCKIVSDADSGVILGVHLLGGSAAEIIFGLAAMLEDEFSEDDVRELVFAHPTVSEIIKDSLL